ncbi:hypothetical protein [Pedobacter ginsengisoli]|uniref:hypothetical protein n=1 Tax=Pedobacter ginsengisoli TaxID=363852 RepID=UPI002549C6BD|nr:hypothetical protein [Pedobacter ginsengisoli]
MAEKNGERLYIQVSYLLYDKKTIEREFGNLAEIADNYPKYVVSMDEIKPTNTYKGIQHIHLREFLLTDI